MPKDEARAEQEHSERRRRVEREQRTPSLSRRLETDREQRTRQPAQRNRRVTTDSATYGLAVW